MLISGAAPCPFLVQVVVLEREQKAVLRPLETHFATVTHA
jgi:hypothetical protein